MRRILSLAMLLLFCWPLIAPAFASPADENLPMCCRRDGAHHCMGNMAAAASPDELSVRPPRCPAYPIAATVFQHTTLASPTASLIFAELLSHPSVKPQTEARARIALDQSSQKRGPPQA